MEGWRRELKFDPIPPLLASGNEAVSYSARRDLLDENPGLVSRLWRLPAAQKILKKQQPDGSWPRPGIHKHEAVNDGLIETWKQFRFLVQEYGFTAADPSAGRAAGFLFSLDCSVVFVLHCALVEESFNKPRKERRLACRPRRGNGSASWGWSS